MQDSLEDYVRLARNSKNNEELPKQVKKDVPSVVTAHLKKECDAKALQIVEFSIEGKLRSQVFLKCLSFIDQDHYQDIVEERAVTKLCGYPICGKKIPEMPKKQYHISTKNNKIYDITQRKNFCSNYCYKASLHIKNQIDNTPLWHRKSDQIPRYNLLEKADRGLPGVEVDQGIIRASPSDNHFTSISSFTHLSLDEIEENELNPDETESDIQVKKFKRIPKHYHHKSSMKTISENEEDDPSDEKEVQPSHNKTKVGNKSPIIETIPEEIDENVEPPPEKPSLKLKAIDPQKIINITNPDRNKINKGDDIEGKISRCFNAWISLETLVYIYGENKVKTVLNNKKLSAMFESLRITELQVDQQRKYLEICRKLNLKELADEKFDKAAAGNDQLKPLPDYQELKAESKSLDLKVKSFYSGVLRIEESSSSITKRENEEETEEGPPVVLPLVDVNSQNALRRKIFLTSLKKPMQRLLDSLVVEEANTIISDVQTLVKTFALKADNIVLKPNAWPILSILLIKILCLKDSELQQILEKDSSKELLDLTLSSLPSKGGFIDDLLDLVKDFEKCIEICICK